MNAVPQQDLHPALEALNAAFSPTDVVADGDWLEFPGDDVYVIANVTDRGDRIRIRVYLDIDEEQAVQDWVGAQPAPLSGLIEAAYLHEGEWRPRLVFERPLDGVDWSTDPLFGDVERYLAAWRDDDRVHLPTGIRRSFVVRDDPRNTAPASAWLLKGSEASFPGPDELLRDREASDVGIFEWEWTTAPQMQIGDLVLFYFLDPRKAVHFVARAASKAFFSRDIEVAADHTVNRAQWWGYFTTPIAIEPIPVALLREAAGGFLPLRGRSGLYLRPDTIENLHVRAQDPEHQAELERVFTVPVGLPDLPKPANVTHAVWRDLAAGALPLEAHVSSHLVEPLLRDLLAGTGLTWAREHAVGPRRADFVIFRGATPIHVIEVKKVIKEGPDGGWRSSPDLAQLRWYADNLGTASTLIDSHRLLLIPREGTKPSAEVSRRSCSATDLAAIRRHLCAT